MELPSNLLFRLGERISLIIKNDEIFKVESQGSSKDYLFIEKEHPLKKVDTISRLEELYKTNFSSEIEKWKSEKMKEILGKELEKINFSKEEFELRKFIVHYIIPHLGVSPRFKERKIEEKRKREMGSIWESMLKYRDYDLDMFAIFNFGRPQIYKLEEGEFKDNHIHVKIDGKKYYFTEFEYSFYEIDRE
ncbi:MAG: hypothetical protein QW140_01085, partial [Candidatus Aenigmatarchaeota archaeon]